MRSILGLSCVAVVLSLASLASADPVNGPITGVTRVQAYSVNEHRVLYRGGEQADFTIVGDGDTTLNVVVRDANGNEVFRTRGPGDRFNVSWRPTWTGYYTISVINQGGVYNRYVYKAY